MKVIKITPYLDKIEDKINEEKHEIYHFFHRRSLYLGPIMYNTSNYVNIFISDRQIDSHTNIENRTDVNVKTLLAQKRTSCIHFSWKLSSKKLRYLGQVIDFCLYVYIIVPFRTMKVKIKICFVWQEVVDRFWHTEEYFFAFEIHKSIRCENVG